MGNKVSSFLVAVVESNPLTASVKSLYHLCKGQKSEAKQSFMRGLELFDTIPGVGHIKAGIHKLAKDDEGAGKVFKSANRSTLVVGAAAAVVATGGGALLAVGCAVGAGQAYNLATGESKLVGIVEAIKDKKESGWDKFGNVVLQAAGLGLEVAGDVAGAKLGVKFTQRFGPAQGLKPNSRNPLTQKCDRNIGEVIKEGGPGGDVYHNKAANTYTKFTENLTKEGYDPQNYTAAMKNGIGPNALQTPRYIHMEGGVSLQQAVEKGLISKKSMRLQVDQLHNKCKKLELAHCDVKLDNMIVTKQAQVRLIDFDHLAKYGERRTVHTPSIHKTPYDRLLVPCDYLTDHSGFKNVRDSIAAFKPPTLKTVVASPLREHVMLSSLGARFGGKSGAGSTTAGKPSDAA